jgi:hypothetical protein
LSLQVKAEDMPEELWADFERASEDGARERRSEGEEERGRGVHPSQSASIAECIAECIHRRRRWSEGEDERGRGGARERRRRERGGAREKRSEGEEERGRGGARERSSEGEDERGRGGASERRSEGEEERGRHPTDGGWSTVGLQLQ